MKVRRVGVAVIILLICLPLSAMAQQSVGVRAGVSADPDQFLFGGHLETAPLLERLVFRPNAEIGVGDGLVIIGLNFEFAFKIGLDDQAWTRTSARVLPSTSSTAAIAAGVAVTTRASKEDSTFSSVSKHDGGLFTELKVGALDSPDLKFIVGYAF